MKLRNLILSLFLAAGVAAFAACDGTTGPSGVAGGAGPAGPAGPAGDAGKAGDSADEVMRSYAYLKTWGKTEGKAACSDPVLRSMDTFPGPATLKKLATAQQTTKYLLASSVTLGMADADPITPEEGECSDAVYSNTAFSGGGGKVFKFMLTHGDDTNDVTERKTGGTTPTLKNRTLTVVRKQFREGDVEVMFKQGASEIAERDLLFTRCDIPNGLSGSTLKGKYRLVKITETEYLLKTVANFTDPDTTTGVAKTTKKVCVRFSAPGTVKCFITETAQKRRTSDDQKAPSSEDVTTDQIVLYKDGEMMQVAPMPDSKTNLVPGKTPGLNATLFETGFGLVPPKLCNFFAGGVIGTAAVASTAAPSSTGGGGPEAACRATGVPLGDVGNTRAVGQWTPGSGGSPGSCACAGSTGPNAQGECNCSGSARWRTNPDPRDSTVGCF